MTGKGKKSGSSPDFSEATPYVEGNGVTRKENVSQGHYIQQKI